MLKFECFKKSDTRKMYLPIHSLFKYLNLICANESNSLMDTIRLSSKPGLENETLTNKIHSFVFKLAIHV